MLKKYLLLLALLTFSLSSRSQANDSLVKRLDAVIKNKQLYISKKEKRISEYKSVLATNISRQAEYSINEQLYGEYRKFRIDSAKYYTKRNIELAELMKNDILSIKAQIQLANLYSSSGDFLESKAILENITAKELPLPVRSLYYEFYSQFYEHYATNSPGMRYWQQIEVYRDSLLAITNRNSNKYNINLAQHHIYKKDFVSAKKLLTRLVTKTRHKGPDYVMFVYLLGDIAALEKNEKSALDYYYMAAISDIENAIKDHAAIQNLATKSYSAGKIDLAYKYVQSALEDAIFCNVKFRTLAMSEFTTIVNAAYQAKEEKQKQQLKLYLVLISVLTIFSISAAVYVYRQMKKVSHVKEQLSQSAAQLKKLNSNISQANKELQESNRIKEEYIAQFFDICSSYINKLEEYRRKLNVMATNKRFEDLAKVLKSNDFTNNELQDLYRNFDIIFVNLYPRYVDDFNDLLSPGEKITLKDNEILSTEMRIFALERLGITDSVKIASFLRFSVSTIYNYRTKIRNKSNLTREEFERQVQSLGDPRE